MKPVVLFLEPKGTVLEVVRAIYARGYSVFVICSDRSLIDLAPSPYVSAVALIDRIIEIDSWNNSQAVWELFNSLCDEHKIVGAYSGMDPCAELLADLRTRLGLPTAKPSSLRTVLDKYKLRKFLRDTGLSELQNIHSSETENLSNWPFSGPAYFKPTHGFFSAYVKRCSNLEDFYYARREWDANRAPEPKYVRNYLRKSGEFHLEQAIDGELLSVESISIAGEFQCLGLLSRILYSQDPVVEMGSCFPYPHPLTDKIVDKVRTAHRLLGLTDGPCHTEVIVDYSGNIEIIDLNPRFVGADVLQSINYAYDIEIQEELANFAIGKSSTVQISPTNFSCIQYFMPPEVPIITHLSVPTVPEVPFSTFFMKIGDQPLRSNRQLDYLGCYLTVMPTFEEAIARSHALRSEVKINHQFEGRF